MKSLLDGEIDVPGRWIGIGDWGRWVDDFESDFDLDFNSDSDSHFGQWVN